MAGAGGSWYRDRMKKITVPVLMVLALGCTPGKGETDSASESGGSESGSTGTTTAEVPTTGGSGTLDLTTGGEPGACVAASPGGPAVDECEIKFCPPTSWHIVARNEEGTPGLTCDQWNGAWCDTTGNLAYEFENELLFIYLSFKPEVAEEHSDASFKANFDYFWTNVYFRPDPTDHSEFYRQIEAMDGLAAFESFKFEDGRLKARFTIDVDMVWQRVESKDPDCLSGDISGQCACRYEGFNKIPVTVDLDLSVDM